MAKGKNRRAFYRCSVCKECTSIDINNNNDLPEIHPACIILLFVQDAPDEEERQELQEQMAFVEPFSQGGV